MATRSLRACLVVSQWALAAQLGWAQTAPAAAPADPAPAATKPAAKPAEAKSGAKEEKKPLPAPADMTFKTRDFVGIGATYFGSNLGKDAVPVLLVHDYKGTRHDYDLLAAALQKEGHAVLSIDLRGHGESTKYMESAEGAGFNAPAGKKKKIDAAKLTKADLDAMVTGDMKAARQFLVKENDAGNLNLNKLCVVGSGMGALIALHWARLDWSAPQLTSGKQGRDTRALVLLSPLFDFKGVTVAPAIEDPNVQRQISLLFIFGEQTSQAKKGTERLEAAFAKYHPEPTGPDAKKKKDLFKIAVPTTLQGTDLVKKPQLSIADKIAKFIGLRLVDQEFEWVERALPGT